METAPAELSLFRCLYCGCIALVTAVQLRAHLGFLRQTAPHRPIPLLFGRLSLPRLNPNATLAIGLANLGALAAAAVGWQTSLALFGAVLGTMLYHAQVIEFPTVRRKTSNTIVILLLLGFTTLAGADPEAMISHTCILTIQLVVAQMYVSSGVAKLRHAGVRWADGQTLRAWMIDYYFIYRHPAALRLASSLRLCHLVSLGVLVFELSFWLMIPFPVLAWIYLPLGLAFHGATAVLMRIHYWIYALPAYLIFLLPYLTQWRSGR